MGILEIIALLPWLLLNPLLANSGRFPETSRIWTLCWVVVLPYITVLLIAVSFPYSYSYPRNEWVTALVIGIIEIYAFALYVSFRKGMQLPSVNIEPTIFSLYLSYTALALSLVEFAINPSSRLTNDLLTNREIQSGIIGTISKVLSGASLFCFQVAITQFLLSETGGSNNKKVRKSKLLYLKLMGNAFPYVSIAIITLLTGNRQYAFFGIFLFILTGIFLRGVRFIFNPAFLLSVILIAFLGVGLFFIRNGASTGRQDEFLINVMTLREKAWNPFSNHYELNSTGMLIYSYYGIEYNVLSATIDGKISVDEPFISTAPILYRRLQGPFGLPNPLTIMDNVSHDLQAQLNSFGVVWPTMFGAFYLEFGWVTFIVYSILILTGIVFFGYMRRYYISQQVLLIGICAAIVFGIQYCITAENFGAFYLLILLSPGSWFIKTNVIRAAGRNT